MSGEERRAGIVKLLIKSNQPMPGKAIAAAFDVSRQVIVQDIALLRADGFEIFSTNRGYVMTRDQAASRVFKVFHQNDQVQDELNAIVDLGGTVEDVFIFHKVYGIMRGSLGLKSRYDVEKYLETIGSGKSHLLMNVTSGYHYHTVKADSETILDFIQQKLDELGFLAPLQDYEPVDFSKSGE